MEYNKINNGWAIQVHTPIQEITDNDILTLAELVSRNIVVFWKKQNVTRKEQNDFCLRFGGLEDHFEIGNNESTLFKTFEEQTTDEKGLHPYPEFPGIVRVSGQPDENNEVGLFGWDADLNWHQDKAGRPFRKPYTWLHAAEGSKGSRTRYTNHYLAYSALPDEKKAEYEKLQVKFSAPAWLSKYQLAAGEEFDMESYMADPKKWWPPEGGLYPEGLVASAAPMHEFVVSNPWGDKGLHFSPYETMELSGHTHDEMMKFTSELLDYVTQPEFLYVHEWDDGDVLLSESIASIHKRDAFDGMKTRVMDRIAFDLDNIYEYGLIYEGYNGVLS